MSQRAKLLTAGAAGLILVAVAVWFFIFRDTSPEAVSLESAVGAVSTTSTTVGPQTTVTTSETTATTTESPPDDGSLDGTWTIDTDRGAGVVEASSFVGYRVQEELASIGTTTAVGRSTALTGSFTFAGSTLAVGDIVVDMTQLMSDSRGRDGQMRRQALETDAFPEATFSVTEAVDLGSPPEAGAPFQADVTGDLTIHGVTQRVTIAIEGQLIDNTVVVIGSTEIVFADYDIAQPRAAVVLSVEDVGVMEFQLFLTKA